MKKYINTLAIAFAVLAGVFISGCGPSKPVLNVYMWSDYIDMDLVKEFEKENNCRVVIDIFDSNEFMYSKLKAGGTGYDVILPTSYMAKVMFDQNMLSKLDLSKIPNSKYINKKVLSDLAIDKKMEYSIPYMLGYTCVAYNKEKVGDLPASWDVFSNEKFAGKMTMLNDHREAIGAALFYLGKSMNSVNEQDLAKAKEILLKWKKNLAKFDNELYKVGIQSGEFLIVQRRPLSGSCRIAESGVYVPQGRHFHELRRLGNSGYGKKQGACVQIFELYLRAQKRRKEYGIHLLQRANSGGEEICFRRKQKPPRNVHIRRPLQTRRTYPRPRRRQCKIQYALGLRKGQLINA